MCWINNLLLDWTVAEDEVREVAQGVEVALVVVIQTEVGWDLLAVDGEGDLLSLVEDGAGWLSEDVVDSPVAEEEVEVVQQGLFVFLGGELLLELLVTDHFCDQRNVHVLDLVGELGRGICDDHRELRVVLLGVYGVRKLDLHWPDGVLLGHFACDYFQIDESWFFQQKGCLMCVLEVLECFHRCLDLELVYLYVLFGLSSPDVVLLEFDCSIFLMPQQSLDLILPLSLYSLHLLLLNLFDYLGGFCLIDWLFSHLSDHLNNS